MDVFAGRSGQTGAAGYPDLPHSRNRRFRHPTRNERRECLGGSLDFGNRGRERFVVLRRQRVLSTTINTWQSAPTDTR